MKTSQLKFLLGLQLIFLKATAQNADTIYLNDRWQICEKSFATYYRIGTAMQLDSFVFYSGPVRDYYLNGATQMEGNYSTVGLKDGKFSFYYPGGKIQAQGNFANNQTYGTWNYYYPNGSLKAKIYYSGDENSFIVLDYFDSTGKQLAKDGTGKFEIRVKDADGVGINSYILTGEFTNGQRDGVWKYFGINKHDHSETLFRKEIYEGTTLKRGESYNISDKSFVMEDAYERGSVVVDHTPIQLSNFLFYDKFFATERFFTDKFSFELGKINPAERGNYLNEISLHADTKDTLYAMRNVEIEAAFTGGDLAWRKFLEKYLRPDIALEKLPGKIKSITQIVWVEFVVCLDGTACEIKTLNDVYPSLKDEAERVVRLSSGHWLPAILNGKSVKSFKKLPITFRHESN